MTDNEIIKALECCSQSKESSACNGCLLLEKTYCEMILMSSALDLINRLQAENKSQSIMIKMLNGSIEDYKNSYINQKAEIERLQTEKDNLIRTYSECQIANLQEFMHRVENKLANNTDISMVGYQSVICNMEETYKELVGD